MLFLLLLFIISPTWSKTWDFEKAGGIPNNSSLSVMWINGRLMNKTLQSMQNGDVFLLPNKTFHTMGGIMAWNLSNNIFQIDGTLSFSDDRDEWPKNKRNDVLDSITIYNSTNIIMTSSGIGTLNGNGAKWWGYIQYLKHTENRPKLLFFSHIKGIIVENIHFIDPAYWTTYFKDIDNLTIRYCEIDVHVSEEDRTHNWKELSAFNTDGFDVAGSNVHIHDVKIWNDDDCICAKDLTPHHWIANGTENWLVERVNVSGIGLTIGSIGGAPLNKTYRTIRNITFRDAVMNNPYKGIYMKSRFIGEGESAIIEDILFENITINNPSQFGIFIGPAQQTEGDEDCSLLWPQIPGQQCPSTGNMNWRNIVLRDITVNNPKKSPGAIIGNNSNPMTGLVFENVKINNPGSKPFGDDFYACWGVKGAIANGTTDPIPPCFNNDDPSLQCTAKGSCQNIIEKPCCSGSAHSTFSCFPYSRCGCLENGDCADSSSDCCSGHCHKTLDCGLGLTCRCNSADKNIWTKKFFE